MKKLIIVTALVFIAAIVQASQLYYQFPTSKGLKASDRIMIFQNSSANRNPAFGTASSANITGATLKTGVNTDPVLRTRYGNFSSIVYVRYSSNGLGVPSSGRVSSYYATGSYMYFNSDGAMVISNRPPQ